MPEKQEHTMIGLNKSTMALVALVLTVVAAMAFWFDRGSTKATAATLHDTRVGGHETRITKAEMDIDALDTRMDDSEKAQIRIEGNQKALLDGQLAIRDQRKEDAQLAREQRKEDIKVIQKLADSVATSNAYFYSLDNVKPSE